MDNHCLDTTGIVDQQTDQMTAEEEDALQQFNSSCKFQGERYEVGFPWKKDHPSLADTYKQAYRRMESTERKLAKDSKKAKLYCEALKQYTDDGHA